ncbi:MAG: nucleoside recognition domain-containing protein, partial [Zestosphaera sp.]
ALIALNLSTAQGVAILTFMMLYVPCVATLAVIYQESKSVKFTVATVLYLLLVALAISLVVYFIMSILI